jgi:hypothetical protein
MVFGHGSGLVVLPGLVVVVRRWRGGVATAAAVIRGDFTVVTVVVRDLIRAATVDDRVHDAREPAVPPQPEDGVTDGKLRGGRCADRDPRLPATGRTR